MILDVSILSFKQVESHNGKALYHATFECIRYNIDYLNQLRIMTKYKQKDFEIIGIIPSENYTEKLKKLLASSNANTENRVITYPMEYNEIANTHFNKTPGDEGLEMNNEEVKSNLRSAFGYVLAQISKNLIKGRFTLAYSLPIYVFDCRTSIEFFCWDLRLIPKRALKCIDDKADTVEKIKQLTIFLITMNRTNLPFLNPLMPTLGETFQCKIEDLECYFETTKANPPIFNFYIKGKHLIAWGYWYLSQTQGANSLANESCGKFNVRFLKDNEVFSFSLCTFLITGFLFGKNLVSLRNNITVKHEKSGLMSAINLNPVKGGGWYGLWGRKQNPPDEMSGFIGKIEDFAFDEKNSVYSIQEGRKPIGVFTGEWSEYIAYNDEVVWRKEEDTVLPPMVKMDYTLKSDSLFREDAIFLRNGLQDLGEEAKAMIEENEKADEYLREEYREKQK